MFSTSTAANSEGIQSNTSIREHHSVDYVLALDRWSRLGIRELGDLENKPRSTGVICERVGIKSKSKIPTNVTAARVKQWTPVIPVILKEFEPITLLTNIHTIDF